MKWLAFAWLSLVLLTGMAACSTGEPPTPLQVATLEPTANQTPADTPTPRATAAATPGPTLKPTAAASPPSESTPGATLVPTPVTMEDKPEDKMADRAEDTAEQPQTGPSRLPDDPTELMKAILDQPIDQVARKMAESGNRAFIPVLVEFLRFRLDAEAAIDLASSLSRLKDNVPPDEAMVFPKEERRWDWWIAWLGRNPEVRAPDGYDGWKGGLYGLIDPAIGAFMYDGVKSKIRLEEIVWGGVAKDGIPDLWYPPTVPAAAAYYLNPDDRVFGLSINGEHRAYPLRILNPHEMANDTLGGVSFALAY